MSDKKKNPLKLIEKIVIIGLLCAGIFGGILFGVIVTEVASGQRLSLLSRYRPSTPTRLYDRNGRVFAELFRQKQELIPFNEIPPHVVQAFLAVEDDNFFNHFGLDFFGIFRAALKNLRAGRVVQGGSTLTQQLAKQIYLNAEGKRDRTFKQKIRETFLALQMEEELSKEEILEVYFNVIYLGHGCRGISCASRLYFGKKVQDLSVAEGALLSRLPKAPVDYSPFKNPKESMKQHKFVLERMAETGFISASEVDRIHLDFWNVYWGKVIVQSPSQNIWANKLDMAPYFTDYVRQILEVTEEIGEDNLYTRGLHVYTTLDLDQQRIAEEEIKKTLVTANKIGRQYAQSGGKMGVDLGLVSYLNTLSLLFPVGSPVAKGLDLRGQFRKAFEEESLDAMQILGYLAPADNEEAAIEIFRRDTTGFSTNLEVQGAFVGIEPRTGYITAMVGGADFSPQNQFNRAVLARRQPGSAFKIFIYGAALENRNYSSNTGVNDAPFFTIDAVGGTWAPGNYDQGFKGMVPATTAFALSLNTCAVQTYYRLGHEPIIDFATRLLKIRNKNRLHADPALALGSSEVTPLEMATAVAIIANQGRDVIPFPVRYVTDQSGRVIYNQESRIRAVIAQKTKNKQIQVIEPGTAFILRKMMQSVVDHGTATMGVRDNAHFRGEAAAKTGTTSSWSDAWIVGFNPDTAISVWFGFDKSSITMGPGQAGGHIASPVMGYFYKRYYDEKKETPPSFKDRNGQDLPPAGVVEKAACGGLALEGGFVRGKYRPTPYSTECASDAGRIYDQRELLMKELGITPEELGVGKGHIRFKQE